jgi:hypothetical protein
MRSSRYRAGCLQKLTRDELQGVVAHEFSHILNGDMRLNLRLIGTIHGILVIGLIGYLILRGAGSSSSSRSSSSGKDSGIGAVLAMLAVGVALMIIGYVGVFFGRLIQAAVSRQREFLADASSVQFTRNPRGIIGALRKIGGYDAGTSGSILKNPHALETAHLFFASGIKLSFTNLLATHPPIEQRIRALDPTSAVMQAVAHASAGAAGRDRHDCRARSFRKLAAADVTRAVGRPTPQTMRFASDILASVPAPLRRAAEDPFSARALTLALLLADDPSLRAKQSEAVLSQLDRATHDQMLRLMPEVQRLDAAARLPVLEIAVPALRRMSDVQVKPFLLATKSLIEADAQVSLFEYAIFKILRRHLRAGGVSRPTAVKYFSIRPVLPDAVTVISALAYSGKDDASGADAFAAGFAQLDAPEPLPAAADRSLVALDAALNRLNESSPGVKRRIVNAAAHAVAADGIVQR